MRTILSCLLFLFISSAVSSQVLLNVKGIQKLEGVLYIGLYNKKEGFTKVDKTYRYWVIEVDKFEIEITLEDIDQGNYALSIFHDINENGKLDKNFVGMPTEIYGFSNNVRKVYSAPSYESCSFSVQQKTNLVINLQ